MGEHRTVIILSIAIVLMLFTGGGFIVWRRVNGRSAESGQVKGVASVASKSPTAAADASPPPVLSTNGIGITAGPSTSNSLGQVSPSPVPTTTSSGPASTSQSSLKVDPSTFGQYDAYVAKKSALFADVKVGDGDALTQSKKASIYYVGWLTNSTEFDHSAVDAAGSSQDFEFTMGAHQVIAGMEEAMYGMKSGGTRLLIIPPAVGYGSTAHGSIPANSVLVFEVQLLSVK